MDELPEPFSDPVLSTPFKVSYLPGCFPPVERPSDVPTQAATSHRILPSLGGVQVTESQKALAIWS